MTTSLPSGIWARPRAKRWLNHGYLYAINLLHFCLDLMPWFLRNTLWRVLLHRCGRGVFFDNRVYIKFPWLVSVGTDVSVNRGVEFYCGLRERSCIIVGSNVRIAPNVRFHAAGHDPDDPDFQDTGSTIRVEDDVWIGAGAIILPGVVIRRGAVVAAGAVVTTEVPEFTVVAGVPAKSIRTRRMTDATHQLAVDRAR